ncbi:MAG: hypothetical protein DRI48_05200 [Chloroflexi bacterium]|nr:MAG: hypothetical protein DRI48_05200 [Chloroflexota bacterium]
MSTETREETATPLSVIGCLKAGFEIVGRYLWLIAPPVLVDLLLWLGPRVSVAPVLRRFISFLTAQPTPDAVTVSQVEQAVRFLEQVSEGFNLFSFLSLLPLFNPPSLLAWRLLEAKSPLGEPSVWFAPNVLAVVGWGIVLVPIGLVLGFLYLHSLADRIRAVWPADGSEAEGGRPGRRNSTWVKLARLLLFVGVLLVMGITLAPLWALVVGTCFTIAPVLGFLVWSIGIGLGSYLGLHLLFVAPGVLLGDRGAWRATWESILLIQAQFPAVVGLILLALVLYAGLGFVWALPSADSWSLMVGIVGNSCIATGLTAAVFIFYRERIKVVQARQA